MAITKGIVPTNIYERKVYDVLQRLSVAKILDDEYIIMPNVHWLKGKEEEGEDPTESDIILIHPRKGILVIEIKGTAVKGALHYNATQQRFQRGRYPLQKDPQLQVQKSCQRLRRFLQLSLEIVDFSVSPLLWFPVSSRKSLAIPPELNFFILSEDECDNMPQLVTYLEEMVYGSPLHAHPQKTLDTSTLNALVERLSYQTSHRQTEAFIHAMNSDEFRKMLHQYLDPVAEDILRTTRCSIVGGAGTGKTVVAFGLTARLQNAGLDVVMVCSHENQLNWLVTEEHFRQMYPTTTPISIIKASDLLSAEPLARYDAMIIDEAQDIGNAQWQRLRGWLKSPDAGVIYAFRDDMQRDSDDTWNATNLGRVCPQLSLTQNLRNAREIYKRMRVLNTTLPLRTNDELFPEGEVAANPLTVNRRHTRESSEIQVLDAILTKLIEKEHIAPENILLISCRTQTLSKKEQTKSRFFEKDASGLKFPYRPLFTTPKAGHIRLTTIRGSKGLESDVVVIVELDGIQGMSDKVRRKRVYTAISRARYHLIILGSEAELMK